MKKCIIFSLLILSIPALRASESTSFLPKLMDQSFAITNTATALLVTQHLLDNPGIDPKYASKAFMGYVLPCFILNKYKAEIDQKSSNLAAKLQIGISTGWCLYTIAQIMKQRHSPAAQPAFGQPVVVQGQGYGANGYNS